MHYSNQLNPSKLTMTYAFTLGNIKELLCSQRKALTQKMCNAVLMIMANHGGRRFLNFCFGIFWCITFISQRKHA